LEGAQLFFGELVRSAEVVDFVGDGGARFLEDRATEGRASASGCGDGHINSGRGDIFSGGERGEERFDFCLGQDV
jgi:hypothetical protein